MLNCHFKIECLKLKFVSLRFELELDTSRISLFESIIILLIILIADNCFFDRSKLL